MGKWISRIITLLFLVFLIGTIIFVYNRFYFNDFIKANEKQDITKFYRDSKAKYNGENSYCIESSDFNDALFFKELEVKKDTPYRITCMVKTENVVSDNPDTAGACISIMDTAEQSLTLQGTNTEWQKLTLMVDSENNETLRIAFRLGGYSGYSKGKVWFSDFQVEEGKKDSSTTWNVVCFLIDNISVDLKEGHFAFSLTDDDKRLLEDNLNRFAKTIKTFSDGRITVNAQLVEITEPLTTLSYDEENHYYAAPSDLKPLIDSYVQSNEYDHIFIGLRMGNTLKKIDVNQWIGLGSMRYGQIGFSDIKMPDDLSRSTMYKYDIRNDTFPEEVYVHEFLHSLERNMVERGYNFPQLHDNEKFGYKLDDKAGLKDWYKAYMQCTIESNIGLTGLDPFVYTTKPVHASDFVISKKIDIENKAKNPIDAVVKLFKNFKYMVSSQSEESSNNNYITITSD